MRPCASVMGATPSLDAAGGVWYPRILFRNIEKVAAARGLHRMSASMMARLTETTLRSPCCCFSTMKLQRTSMCLLRLRKRFSFERATADSQSSYIMLVIDTRGGTHAIKADKDRKALTPFMN